MSDPMTTSESAPGPTAGEGPRVGRCRQFWRYTGQGEAPEQVSMECNVHGVIEGVTAADSDQTIADAWADHLHGRPATPDADDASDGPDIKADRRAPLTETEREVLNGAIDEAETCVCCGDDYGSKHVYAAVERIKAAAATKARAEALEAVLESADEGIEFGPQNMLLLRRIVRRARIARGDAAVNETAENVSPTADDVDAAFARRLADALVGVMCKSDPDWDDARSREVRAHMRTALAAVGVTGSPLADQSRARDAERTRIAEAIEAVRDSLPPGPTTREDAAYDRAARIARDGGR